MPTISDLVSPHDVALQLPLKFDPVRLLADLDRMPKTWWHVHRGPYHDGNWEGISLWAPNGDRTEQSSKGGAFTATEALRLCDYVPEVVDAFPGRKNRVRFLRLRAGGHIFAHSDPLHQIDNGIVRIHVPVRTNPSVDFTVHGKRIVMEAGSSWYVDVRFRHSVDNPGTEDRIHLVIDIVPNPELSELFERAASSGKGMLTTYFLKHSLPRGLVRRLGLAN